MSDHSADQHTRPIRVVIQQPNLTNYRLPVFQALAKRPGIHLTLAYGPQSGPRVSEASGFDAIHCPLRFVRIGGVRFRWHAVQWRCADRRMADVLVLSWDLHYLTLIPALLRARHHRVATVLWGHGYSKRENRWRLGARKRVARLADTLMFYNARGAEPYLADTWNKDRIFVAFNSLDQTPIQRVRAEWEDDLPRLDQFRQKRQLGPGPIALFVARVSHARRVDLLIRAARVLKDQFPELKIIIIGQGEAEPDLRSLAESLGISGRVRFVGAVYDENELAAWFLNSDVLCFPANMGLSVLHAFGYGLPVVTSDRIDEHGPEIEALKPGENGLTFNAGNADSLAETLRRLFVDPSMRERMSRAASATVREKFTLERMVDEMEAAIRTAHDRSASGQCR